jgi:hemoglobin
MRTRLIPAAAVLLVLASLAGACQEGAGKQAAGDTKAADKQMYDALREVINTGRELFNKNGDYSGCYRVFQGSLITIKPLLTHRPDLQKAIDKGLADAEQMSYTHQRAFALRKVLDTVRTGLKTGEAVVETPEPIALPKPKVEKVEKAEKAAKTEWDRLGGLENVRRIVEDVSARIAKDPKVNLTRGGKYKFTDEQVVALKKKMVELVSEITGGPLLYTGKSMKDAHEGMGITNAEFDAFMGHLMAALKQNGVGPAETESLRKKVEGTRAEIVEEQKGEEKKKAEPATVTGKITFQGKPLPGGTITFHSEGGVIACPLSDNGDYKAVDLAPGAYKVAIKTVAAKDAKGQPPQVVPIPAAYAAPTTSGLAVEVKAGKNVFNFDLK